MTDTPWKATERQIAALIGGRRVPVTGRGRGDAPDIDHPLFSIEVKSRRELPHWLLDALAQAVASARPEQTPIAILHQAGTRYRDSLVVLTLADFLRLTDDEGNQL